MSFQGPQPTPATGSGGIGGIIVIVLLGLALLGGCGAMSSGGSSEPYHDHTSVTTNDDGSSTYHDTDNLGTDFTCTFQTDGSSDCSG